MKMTRRTFGSMGLLVAAAATMPVALTGCNASNVAVRIQQYLGLGIAAISNIVNLLVARGILSTSIGTLLSVVLQEIKAAFADVQQAIAEYENAAASAKSTLLGKISTALNIVEEYLQKLWNDLSIPDSKLASIIQALLSIVLSTIGGFMTQLPPPAASGMKLGPKRVAYSSVRRSAARFRSDFNNELDANGLSQYRI